MSKSRTIPVKIALILVCLFSVSTWAEVKLRIYLQDGTLQAGNLVVENDDSFVILGKEGRIEVKKDKIMFINGKTLKQWQERPDKLFQTEIIPSDIPNPSYVNGKAALPTPTPAAKTSAVQSPVVTPVKPLTAVAPPVTQQAKATPTPTPTPQPPATPKPQPSVASNKNTNTPAPGAVSAAAVHPDAAVPAAAAPAVSKAASAAPVVAAAVPAVVKKGARKRRHHAAPAAVAEAPVSTPAPVKEAPVEASAIQTKVGEVYAALKLMEPPRPARFTRKDMGDYHFQRALVFVGAGQKGRAIQELHLSTTLDRANPESVVLLGKLYLEEGLSGRASRLFNSPLVKKREDVKTLGDVIEQNQKQRDRSKWILYAGSGVGALMWIPLLVGWRKAKKPAKAHVITADTIEATRSVVEEVLSKAAEEMEVTKEPVRESPAPMPSFAKPLPKPLMESPFAPPLPKKEEVTAQQPAFTGFKPQAPRKMEPVVPPPMPPPIVPPPIPPPLPVPEPVAEAPAPIPLPDGLDAESVLRLASMVDRAVRKGNALAVEEKSDLARREYRTALALNPICVEAHVGLGYLSFVQNQFELALEHYNRALSVDPKSADAHYGIGRVFLETEQINEAIREMQKTLELDPSFDDARDTLTALGAVA